MSASNTGGPEKQEGNGSNPVVEVLDLNTNREVKFHVSWTMTLQQVWDKAYEELKEGRRERDQLECRDGHSLSTYLSQTLEQLRQQHICPARKYQIRGETGGA